MHTVLWAACVVVGAESPGAPIDQRIDRLVVAADVRVDFVDSNFRGLELSVPHGIGVSSANTELLARLGWWQPLGVPRGDLVALPLAASWVLIPRGPLVRPVLAWEVGGYLLHRNEAMEVSGWSVPVRWLWLWSSRLHLGVQLDLIRHLALRLGVDGHWTQRIAFARNAPALPQSGWGASLAVVVTSGVPRLGLIDMLVSGVGTTGEL